MLKACNYKMKYTYSLSKQKLKVYVFVFVQTKIYMTKRMNKALMFVRNK